MRGEGRVGEGFGAKTAGSDPSSVRLGDGPSKVSMTESLEPVNMRFTWQEGLCEQHQDLEMGRLSRALRWATKVRVRGRQEGLIGRCDKVAGMRFGVGRRGQEPGCAGSL